MSLNAKEFGILLLAGLAAISLVQGVRNAIIPESGSRDFQWGPSRSLLNHENPYTKYLEYLKGERKGNPCFLSQAPDYPITTYLFLWPYAALDWYSAKTFWAFSNIAFSVLFLFGLQKQYPLKDRTSFLLISLFLFISTPHRMSIGVGQHALLCLAAFIWSVVFSEKNKFTSGFFLSISLFKPTVTLPLALFYFARRKYRVLLYCVLIQLVLIVFVAIWIGEGPSHFSLQPLEVCLLRSWAGDMDIMGISRMLNLPGYLSVAGIICLSFLAATAIPRHKKGQDLLLLSFLALLSYALFFHRRYDLVILLFPLWLLFHSRQKNALIFLLSSLIGISWGIQKIFDVAVNYFHSAIFLNQFVHVLTILIFYSAIFTMYFSLTPLPFPGKRKPYQFQ